MPTASDGDASGVTNLTAVRVAAARLGPEPRSLPIESDQTGISVTDIARMTGYSKQSLHAWMRERMVPIPAVHLGISGPPPGTLEEGATR